LEVVQFPLYQGINPKKGKKWVEKGILSSHTRDFTNKPLLRRCFAPPQRGLVKLEVLRSFKTDGTWTWAGQKCPGPWNVHIQTSMFRRLISRYFAVSPDLIFIYVFFSPLTHIFTGAFMILQRGSWNASAVDVAKTERKEDLMKCYIKNR
jgi:hypothetical protein